MAEPPDQSPDDDRVEEDPRLRIPDVLREPPPAPDPVRPRREGFGEAAKAWGMALDLVFTAVGGFFLGYLFDLWRGTGPWGAVVGLGLGFVTAFIRLIRMSLREEARERRAREAAKGSGRRD